MSKNISNSNNLSSTQENSYTIPILFNFSKIFKRNVSEEVNNMKIKMISLDSTPNILNKKKIHNFHIINNTVNNTYSNDRFKKDHDNSDKSSRRSFSGSQGYYNFSKSFNKKYKNKNNNVNYLNPNNNKYLGINLNFVSNSSHIRKENNKIYFRNYVNIKTINNENKTDIFQNNKDIDKYKFIKGDNKKIKKNIKSLTQKIENEQTYIKLSNNLKKKKLNSSTSNEKQSSHLENASVYNQSTPVSSFHPYEADSSPTNYVKSYSNINNLNQSEFTYINNSNKISEKEEEKKIGGKFEILTNGKNKKNKKLNKNINDLDIINISNSNSQKTIEEKDEEYLNSMNSKIIKSKGKENNNLSNEESNIKEKESGEIKIFEKERIYNNLNFENKDNSGPTKIKDEDSKNSNENKNININNNLNKISIIAPKKKINNAKLNFDYFSENKENIDNQSYIINPMNYINIRQYGNGKQKTNVEYSPSYFFNYGSSAIIDTGIFYTPLINNIYDNNKNKIQNLTLNEEKIKKNSLEKQTQFEIIPKKENKIINLNNNNSTSFNFCINKKKENDFINNKRSNQKKNIRNSFIDKIKENEIENLINSKYSNIQTKTTYRNNIGEKTLTKDASTQYEQEIKDNNDKNNLFFRNYIESSNNGSKTNFKNKFLNHSKKILFDFEESKKNNESINYNNKIFNTTSYKIINSIDKIPHHDRIGKNSSIIWKDFLQNKNCKSEFIKANKFNRKINSFVFPANPFDSINKAREYFFFNDPS